MTLPVYSFQELTLQQQAYMTAVSSKLLDFSPGSIILALIEANSGNSMWLQGVAASLLSVTRLATSFGNDVDTFIQDFGFYRYQGNPASGDVTFSRLTTGQAGIIPVGTVVSVSSAANLTYVVIAPPTGSSYAAYNVETNSYIIGAMATSCLAPVVCQQNGTIGNVAAGAINVINPSLAFVSAVSNAFAYANGQDIWNDAVTKEQFVLYLASLARATKAAIAYSISIVPGVARWILVENMTTDGVTQYGFFYAVVDGGGGSASDSLLAAVVASIETYRGFTIQYEVIGPTPIAADIVANLVLIPNPTETNAQIILNVQNAVKAYINLLGFGQTLYISRLIEVIYDADPNILDIPIYPTTNYLTINSVAADLTATNPYNVITPGTIAVNIL